MSPRKPLGRSLWYDPIGNKFTVAPGEKVGSCPKAKPGIRHIRAVHGALRRVRLRVGLAPGRASRPPPAMPAMPASPATAHGSAGGVPSLRSPRSPTTAARQGPVRLPLLRARLHARGSDRLRLQQTLPAVATTPSTPRPGHSSHSGPGAGVGDARYARLVPLTVGFAPDPGDDRE